MRSILDENYIKNAQMIVFLEGYLWDEGEPKKAFEKAIKILQIKQPCLCQIFFVLKDINKSFLDLVKNKLDIIFANEQEILSLINDKITLIKLISFSKETINKIIVITRGEKGAVVINKDEVIECSAVFKFAD